MIELAIIADDLTGALDAAAPFALRGIRTAVALGPAALPEAAATGARVVGVSTHSRELRPELAHAAVRQAVAAVPRGTALFKKVDSRLKGNIEAELDAIAHRRSLVVPAIPAFGRRTRNGRLEGFGLSEPVDIAARLGRHAARATIPDIDGQADIERALRGEFDLPVGARGLAEAIAASMSPVASRRTVEWPDGRAYCVVGSTDPITLAQLDHLRAGDAGLTDILAPNGVGPADPERTGRLTLIQATAGASPVDGGEVAAALAETLLRLKPAAGSLLVLSGGASAQTILERLGIRVLEVQHEALPGLPVAEAGGLTVVTKSGGFGEPGTLSRLLAPYALARTRVPDHVG